MGSSGFGQLLRLSRHGQHRECRREICKKRENRAGRSVARTVWEIPAAMRQRETEEEEIVATVAIRGSLGYIDDIRDLIVLRTWVDAGGLFASELSLLCCHTLPWAAPDPPPPLVRPTLIA